MLTKTRLKYIQSLGQKKFRDAEQVFLAEGPRLVGELLKEKTIKVREVYALEAWCVANESLAKDVELVNISEQELEKLSQLKTPNQVLAIAEQWQGENDTAEKGRLTLALDDIQDPGNLGTIIRLADWFGIDKIICSLHTADVYNAKVVQATMGSIARVQCHYRELSGWFAKQDVPSYAAALEGCSIHELGPIKEGILLIGNEGKGIQEGLLDQVNEKITIPRVGRAESLNAAIAAGIILSHLVK